MGGGAARARRAYEAAGYPPARALELAEAARRLYVDPSVGWALFDDTLPALERLSQAGWTHAILSNHVPELRQIVAALGLDEVVAFLSCSAETGYEKPHAQAFASVLDALRPAEAWMVGDNVVADVLGAEALGHPGGARAPARPARGALRRLARRRRGVPQRGGGGVSDLRERAEALLRRARAGVRRLVVPARPLRARAGGARALAGGRRRGGGGARGASRRAARVLELAAGTGIWTRRLVELADRVVAVDANAETLALNTSEAELVRADVFEWEPAERFDLVFFSFWLSHVPEERFDEFWSLVRGRARARAVASSSSTAAPATPRTPAPTRRTARRRARSPTGARSASSSGAGGPTSSPSACGRSASSSTSATRRTATSSTAEERSR